MGRGVGEAVRGGFMGKEDVHPQISTNLHKENAADRSWASTDGHGSTQIKDHGRAAHATCGTDRHEWEPAGEFPMPKPE